ncbi:ethanolamine utilization protein EutJ [Caldithrix abyssi]
MQRINERLNKLEEMVNDDSPQKASGPWHVGIDLGTADIVLVVTDEEGEPLAAFMEWAEVVRDGIVVDYIGAVDIVKRLVRQAEQKLGIEIKQAITSFPPGTDPRTSRNVVENAGLKVKALIDEPSSVVHLLNITEGAVVDIGGGTTGLSVAQNGQIIYAADEPTGGHHVTLTIAGNRRISFEEAEKMKRDARTNGLMAVVEPVFQKMAEIIKNHLQPFSVSDVYLSGGTFCFPGIVDVFKQELPDVNWILPSQPLFLTPLAIASFRKKQD